MTTILHNFSLRPDLAWHAEVIGAVQDLAAARGIDVLITVDGRQRVATLLLKQTDETIPGLLANEMNRNDPDRAIALLRAMHRGLLESEPK